MDEQGKPVAGAKVEVRLASDPKPAKGDGRVRYNTWLAEGSDAATTDAEGRWQIDNVPDHPRGGIEPAGVPPGLRVRRALAASAEGRRRHDGDAAAGHGDVTLKRGVIVRGRVTDPAGKPVKDAIVIHGDDPYLRQTTSKFPTDAEGRFRLPALAAGADDR